MDAYVGDFRPGQSVRCKWNGQDPTGAPVTASSVTVKVYKDDSTTTETTTGVTHTEDQDSTTGMHHIVVDTSADGTFYAAGSDYFIVATAVTINGISMPGLVLGHFSILNRSVLPDSSGRVTVGSIVNGAIAAATFAANALDAVWSTATRLLTAGTNIALAKGTGVTGFNDLDAAGVRTAVGLAAANLDTQLSALDVDILTRAATGDAMTLTTGERAAIAAALLDLSDAVETSLTMRGALRVMSAALAGKVSGMETGAPAFRNTADSKTRISASCDANGNRVTVTVDPS